MELKDREEKSYRVVAVEGELDATSAPRFEQHCTALIAAGARRLLIDLGTLRYISSAGLRSLLVIAKQLRAAGGGLAVFGLHGMAAEVFEVAGFSQLLGVGASEAEAAGRLDG
jgi:anti-sigma B factor antagonist